MNDTTADRDPIEMLADSFLTRFRQGERPAVEEYVRKYPELADEIRELLPALVLLEQGKSAVGDVSSSGGAGAIERTGIPRRLGDYLVLREIGRGGMGIVYEAVQESLGRHVALKVLPSAGLAGSALERFRLEARAAARLHHTNIVPVFGVGEDQGVSYYAMQFIRGQGLDAVIDELRRRRHGKGDASRTPTDLGRLAELLTKGQTDEAEAACVDFREFPAATLANADPTRFRDDALLAPLPCLDTAAAEVPGAKPNLSSAPSEAHYHRGVARVGLQVAEALAYAHGQGILHRDVKPSNLLLDGHGIAWVTDFGLAKAEGSDGPTRTGDVVGTLRYMAPERFDGRSDPRSDVYSLGATLYELLTLRPPFEDTSRPRLIDRILHGVPQAPRRLDSSIPCDLDTIVLKAMAREPSARYASAAALAEDLYRFLADRPILARRAGLAESAWRWCRRNPAVAGLTASLVLLLAAIAISSTALSFRLRVQRNQLREQGQKLEAESNHVHGLLRQAKESERLEALLLRDSLLAQARAGRYSGRPGRRFASLQAIARAVTIAPSVDLRNEAIACLALADINPLPAWAGFERGGHELGFDRRFERYAQIERDGTVCVRQVGDGTVLKRLVGAGRAHGYPSFSPDGRWLAVARHDRGRCVVYDLGSGARVLDVPAGVVHASVAWSPDSRRLAAIGDKALVHVYDTATWRAVSRFGQGFDAYHLAYDPAGDRLAVTSAVQDEVRVINAHDGAVLWRFRHPADVQAVAWHPEGRLLATACNDTFVRLLDVTRTGGPLLTIDGHLSSVTDVAFHPEGNLLASYGWDGMMQIWDAHTGKPVVTARVDPGSRLCFSADGRRLASGVKGEHVILWEVATGRECRALRGPKANRAGPWALGFSMDDRILASAGPDNVRLWDCARGRELAVVPADRANSVDFLPGGNGLITAGAAGVELWPMATAPSQGDLLAIGAHRLLIGFAQGTVNNAVRLVGGGRRIVALDSASGTILALAVERPDDVRSYPGNHGAIFLATTLDGRWAATSGRGATPVRIWDLEANVLVGELPITECRVAFSPDDRWLVLGTPTAYEFVETGTWSVGARLERNEAHLAGPLAFSTDGRLLAFAYSDRDVRVVTMADRTTLATFTAPDALLVSCIAFSHHDDFLAVGTENRVIHLWDLRRIGFELARLGMPRGGPFAGHARLQRDQDDAGAPVAPGLRIEVLSSAERPDRKP